MPNTEELVANGRAASIPDGSGLSLTMPSVPAEVSPIVETVLAARQPMFVAWGAQLHLHYNEAFAGLLRAAHPAALGQPLSTVLSDIWPQVEGLVTKSLLGEAVFEPEVCLRPIRDNAAERTWVTVSLTPVRNAEAAVVALFGTVADVTSQVEDRRRLALQVDLADRISALGGPVDISSAAAEVLGESLGAGRAGYGEIVDDEVVRVHRDWTSGPLASLAGEARLLNGFGPDVIAVLRAGRTLVVDDCLLDARVGPENRETWSSIGVRALIVAPLLRQGELTALLYVHEAEARRWSRSDVQLVEDVAARTWDAVGRARAEARLRESEARARKTAELLEAIGQSSPDLIYAKDRDCRMIYANGATLSLLGLRADEVIGRAAADYALAPEEGEAHTLNDRAVMASGQTVVLDEVFTAPDGVGRIYRSTKAPLRDTHGEIIGTVGVSVDVTDRRAMEAALRTSEERLRIALQVGQLGDWDWDASTDEVRLSEVASAFFGLPAGEPITWGAMQRLLHPDDAPRAARAVEAAVQSGGDYRAEYRVRRPHGTAWIMASGRLTFDQDGRPTGLIGVVRDTTDERIAEAELRASEERLRLAQRNARAVTWENDAPTGVTYWSDTDTLRDIAGIDLGASTRLRDWVELIHPDDKQAYFDQWLEVLAKGEGRVSFRILRAGKPRWLDVFGQVTEHTHDGRPKKIIGITIDVTERLQASEALQAREEQLTAIFSQTAAGLAQVDLAGRFTLVNDRFCEITGRSRDELLHLRMQDITHPADLVGNLPLFERAVAKGAPYTIEKRYVRPDGSTVWISNSVSVIRSQGGEPYGVLAVTLDMTDRKRAEADLQASESRLRLAIDAGRMAVWSYDIGANTVIGSAELNHLLGYPADAVLDIKELRTRYFPGDHEKLFGAAQAALAKGERHFEAEYRFMRRDGEPGWFLLRAEMLLDAAGQPERAVGVLIDITATKKVEEQLREREGELNAALNAGSLAIIDYDHAKRKLRQSPRLNELYGYPKDHMLTLEDIRARYHPDAAAVMHAEFASHEADVSLLNFKRTFRLLMPDGAERWVEGMGEYLRDDAGRLKRTRGVVLDITERKRWEEHQALLINELNHRVKNSLAIVQGLAHQSFKANVPADTARTDFEARLTALSSAHSLLTRENWQSATLAQIVETTVASTAGTNASRVSAQGPQVLLSPQTAVSIAMAMHELSTNSIKYGALSNDTGRISIVWSIERQSKPQLRFRWEESGGPLVTRPSRRGFGSRMIERGLSAELNGAVRMEFHPAGLVCTIEAPLPQVKP